MHFIKLLSAGVTREFRKSISLFSETNIDKCLYYHKDAGLMENGLKAHFSKKFSANSIFNLLITREKDQSNFHYLKLVIFAHLVRVYACVTPSDTSHRVLAIRAYHKKN